jgi:hypothetical protein
MRPASGIDLPPPSPPLFVPAAPLSPAELSPCPALAGAPPEPLSVPPEVAFVPPEVAFVPPEVAFVPPEVAFVPPEVAFVPALPPLGCPPCAACEGVEPPFPHDAAMAALPAKKTSVQRVSHGEGVRRGTSFTRDCDRPRNLRV